MAELNLAQELPFVLTILDSQDPPQPALIDGVPIYTVSDPSIMSVVLDDPAVGTSGKVVGIVRGTANVSVVVDADRGAGVENLSITSEDVLVTPDPALTQASSLGFAFGPAQPKS